MVSFHFSLVSFHGASKLDRRAISSKTMILSPMPVVPKVLNPRATRSARSPMITLPQGLDRSSSYSLIRSRMLPITNVARYQSHPLYVFMDAHFDSTSRRLFKPMSSAPPALLHAPDMRCGFHALAHSHPVILLPLCSNFPLSFSSARSIDLLPGVKYSLPFLEPRHVIDRQLLSSRARNTT